MSQLELASGLRMQSCQHLRVRITSIINSSKFKHLILVFAGLVSLIAISQLISHGEKKKGEQVNLRINMLNK